MSERRYWVTRGAVFRLTEWMGRWWIDRRQPPRRFWEGVEGFDVEAEAVQWCEQLARSGR